MKPPFTDASVLHGTEQCWVGEKAAVLNHEIDAGNIHVDDPASADIEVTNFAIAHLSLGKAHVFAAGVDQRVRVLAQQAVVGGLASEGDSVSFDFRAVTPPIENYENKRFRTRHKLPALSLQRLIISCSISRANQVQVVESPWLVGVGAFGASFFLGCGFCFIFSSTRCMIFSICRCMRG